MSEHTNEQKRPAMNERQRAAMNERQSAALGGLRVARTNYTVRTASFAYCFLVIGLVLLERKMGVLAWSLLALQFLVYPQLAYLHASAAKDARRASRCAKASGATA